MTYTKIYEVRDTDYKLRFESVNKVDAEFFLRGLLRRYTGSGDKKPYMQEVSR